MIGSFPRLLPSAPASGHDAAAPAEQRDELAGVFNSITSSAAREQRLRHSQGRSGLGGF